MIEEIEKGSCAGCQGKSQVKRQPYADIEKVTETPTERFLWGKRRQPAEREVPY